MLRSTSAAAWNLRLSLTATSRAATEGSGMFEGCGAWSNPLLALLEIERSRVDAIPQPGGSRPVVESVAQVRIALRTQHLYAAHAVGAVDPRFDVRVVGRLPETGPAGARIELGPGLKQLGVAANTAVGAVLVHVPILAGEGRLGAALPRHLILLRRKLGLPFGVGFGDLIHSSSASCFLALLDYLTLEFCSPAIRFCSFKTGLPVPKTPVLTNPPP